MTTARGRGTLFAVLATGTLLFGLVIAVLAGASTSSATPRITPRASVRPASPITPTLHGAGNITSSSKATAPGGPPPPDTLYDQYDNPGTISSSSQNFEASNNSYDDELADDFVIPGGIGWNIQTVDVSGEYFNGPGPASSVNVKFYSNGGNNRPGTLLEARPNQAFTNGPNFSIPLATGVSLGPGTYWVSVQANQNLLPAGQWGWKNRTVQSNMDASWQNPGNGFGTGCTTWGPRTTCVGRRAERAGSGLSAERQHGAAATAASAATAPASELRDHDGDWAVDRAGGRRYGDSLRRLHGDDRVPVPGVHLRAGVHVG